MYNFEDFQVPTSFIECSTDENKREYLTFDETIKIFKKKEELVSLVALGSLRPFFYWEGYLEFSEEMNLETFKDMFNLYDSSKSNESERMIDRRFTTLAYGCEFFRGYITPHTAQPYSIDGSFSLYEIYVFENFTKNGKVIYEYTNKENGESKTLDFDRDYLFDSKIRYSIHPKSQSNEFSLNKCVFLKAHVERQRGRQMEKVRNNEKISKKELFKMVVPVIAKYLFSINPEIKLPDEIVEGEKKGTSEKTIKALVEQYLKDNKDLNSLLSNFESNWQTVMNEKIGDKKRIVLIKESVVADKNA